MSDAKLDNRIAEALSKRRGSRARVLKLKRGQAVVTYNATDPARQAAAFKWFRENIQKNRRKRSGPTATEIIREIRDERS